MTERAMPEGELRTLVAEAIAGTRAEFMDPADYLRADRVLAALRPHLGLGVTMTTGQHRLIWAAASAVCMQNGGSSTEIGRQLLDAIEAFNRLSPSIAGRGEAGTAEGE